MSISTEPENCIIIEPPKRITARKFETVTRATPDELKEIDQQAAAQSLRNILTQLADFTEEGFCREKEVLTQVRLAERHLELALLFVVEGKV